MCPPPPWYSHACTSGFHDNCTVTVDLGACFGVNLRHCECRCGHKAERARRAAEEALYAQARQRAANARAHREQLTCAT